MRGFFWPFPASLVKWNICPPQPFCRKSKLFEFCKLSAQRFFYLCNIWPKNQYGENLNCQWLITSADGLAIEVDFGTPFHLEVSLHKPELNPLLFIKGLFCPSRVQTSLTQNCLNPILHTAWLDNHALTLKRNSAKYYFHEKSRFFCILS